jgi:hypothetical protein
VTLALPRVRPQRSVVYGFPTTCTVQLPQLQGRLMLHLVCLLHHRDSREFKLLHPILLLLIPMTSYVSSVTVQVTVPGTAPRSRISFHSSQLVVAMAVVTTSPATIILGLLLMVVDRLITLISMKLRISELL